MEVLYFQHAGIESCPVQVCSCFLSLDFKIMQEMTYKKDKENRFGEDDRKTVWIEKCPGRLKCEFYGFVFGRN